MEQIRSSVRSFLGIRDYPLVSVFVFLVLLVLTKSVLYAMAACIVVSVLFVILTTQDDWKHFQDRTYIPPPRVHYLPQHNANQEKPKVLPTAPAAVQEVGETATFQQKRELLHQKKKETVSSKKEVYGGKNLKKDFKKTLAKILPTIPSSAPKEQDPKEKELRARVAKELLETERSYVEKLNVLVEVFEDAFRKADILTNDQFVHIFSNIDIIRNFNTILLKDLEQILNNWSYDTRLSGVFLQMADFLKLYTTYINNYSSALETVTFCKQSSVFSSLLEKCESNPRCDSLNFPSLLIMPVQRIPRYILLLTEIHKHTPKNHPDYEKLTQSLNKVKEVADDINEARRDAESLVRLYELSGKLEHIDFELIIPARKLELEGELKERAKGQSNVSGKCRYYFLFSDMLMSTKQKGKHYRMYWCISLTSLLVMSEVNSEFGVSMGERVVFVSGNSPEETRKWAQAIIAAQKNLAKTVHAVDEKRTAQRAELVKQYFEEKYSPSTPNPVAAAAAAAAAAKTDNPPKAMSLGAIGGKSYLKTP